MDNSTFLVAVVDDDPGILKGLSSLLRSEGYRVETFASAQSFLASEVAAATSLLVTDIQMPEIDGLELQEIMRRERPRLPVVVMTAYGDTATRTKAVAGGALELLVKPFPSEALLEQIRLVADGGTG